MDLLLGGLLSAAFLLLSVPAYRYIGRLVPPLLYTQPLVMTGLSGAAVALLSSAVGLPFVICGVLTITVALATGYWGCVLMLDELLRDARF